MSKKRDYSIKGDKESHKLRNGVVVLVILLTLTSIYFIRSGKNNDTITDKQSDSKSSANSNVLSIPSSVDEKPTSKPTPGNNGVVEGSIGAGIIKNNTPADQDLYIYMDGWSRIYTPGDVRIYDPLTGEEATASFKALSADEIKNTLSTAPEVFSSILARLYETDYKLVCLSSSCSDSRGKVDAVAFLSDPTSIPTLGKVYKSYVMKSGIYLAKFKVHANTGLLSLSVGKSNKYGIDAIEKIVKPKYSDELAITAAPENGYGKRTFSISSAFGRIFLTKPSWIGSNPSLFEYTTFGTGDLDPALLLSYKNNPFQNGLGDQTSSTIAKGLNDSQLTFYSSPSTGCGSFAICIPEPIRPVVSNVMATPFHLCAKDGSYANAVAYSADVSIAIPKLSLLNGIERKAIPDFTGKISSVLDNPIPLDLQEGKLLFQQRALLLYTKTGLNYIVSQRSVGSIPQWGAKEVKDYLGSGFTICK